MLAQSIALGAAIAYALSFILSKRGLRHSTPITITFVSLLIQTAALFALVFIFAGIPITPRFVLGLFFVAGVLQAVVRQFTYIGIEKIGAARSGPIRASVPLWSAAIAIFFLGEKMTAPIAAGTLLVFAGIVLISWLSRLAHNEAKARMQDQLARIFYRRWNPRDPRPAAGALCSQLRSGDCRHAVDRDFAAVGRAWRQDFFARRGGDHTAYHGGRSARRRRHDFDGAGKSLTQQTGKL